MESSTAALLRKGKAYRLFVAEYGERISIATERLGRGIDLDGQRDLKARFHMLKGSAGFFGFDEVRKRAAQLEDIFSKAESLNETDLEQARTQIDFLREFQQHMPLPQGEG